jgi:hypothetical protein
MHDPIFGRFANGAVGCKLDIILAVYLADKMLESILASPVAPMVVSYVEMRRAQQVTML